MTGREPEWCSPAGIQISSKAGCLRTPALHPRKMPEAGTMLTTSEWAPSKRRRGARDRRGSAPRCATTLAAAGIVSRAPIISMRITCAGAAAGYRRDGLRRLATNAFEQSGPEWRHSPLRLQAPWDRQGQGARGSGPPDPPGPALTCGNTTRPGRRSRRCYPNGHPLTIVQA